MGQKVNPVGMRIGINKEWNSRWFAGKKEYAAYLQEDIKIRRVLEKSLKKEAEVSHIELDRKIGRDGKVIVFVNIFAKYPNVLNGQETKAKNDKGEKKGEKTETSTPSTTEANGKVLIEKTVKKVVATDTKVYINLIRIENPNLDAIIVAKRIASDLEKRASFRVAQKMAIKDVMAAGAKGIKTEVSGRLAGADIARSEGYKKGIIPLHTLRSDIDYACAEAATIYGRLGVKVWICRGEILPEAKKDDKGV